MKLHVYVGPLPLEPPYFDWDEEEEGNPIEDEGEIDLTELLDHLPAEIVH